MSPVRTIMVGRLDDWLEVLASREGLAVTPGVVSWSGLRCFKHAYGLFQERAYRTRLLAAAYRHHRHWSELVGNDVVLTIPSKWQRIFNASGIEPDVRIHQPVPSEAVNELERLFADFRRAFEPDGLLPDEFDQFGPTVRTLRQFMGSYAELASTVRDIVLPNPDLGLGGAGSRGGRDDRGRRTGFGSQRRILPRGVAHRQRHARDEQLPGRDFRPRAGHHPSRHRQGGRAARERQPLRQRDGDLHPGRWRRPSVPVRCAGGDRRHQRPDSAPVAYYSFGGWKQGLFGDRHIYGPEAIDFYTRSKVVTARWPDPASSSVDLGFAQTR